MKNRSLFLILLLAVFMPWAANAQETLTVCDGTSTSSYAPIKSGGGSQTEFIYPASLLGDMEGGTITSVKFFSSSTSTTNYSNTVTVFVEEVASSTISASAWQYNQSTATKVYEGTTLSVTGGELVITFSTPYEYNGGNLCFNIWSASNTPAVSYYYLATTNSCAYDYYITPPVSVPYSTGNYLPKAEFTYTAASGTCEKPATLEYSNVTTNSVDLTWTGGSGSYEVQYRKDSDQEWTVAYYDTDYTTRTINNLEPATNYQARVQSLCEGEEIDPETGDHVIIGSGWKTVSFTTECSVVTTFPWSEDFENYNSGDFNAPCWVNEHISGNGTQIFKVYTNTLGNNSTHQLQLPDMSNGTMTKLRLPEMTLPTGDSYLFSIDVYRNASGSSYTSEGVRVFASTNGEIEGATELGFLYRNFTQTDGGVVTAETSTGWYTYEFPIPMTGTCYIVLRGESQYGSATYMDNFKVKKILPCVKPSDPTFVSSTTTSATLSWTNGAEGQTAWQIAYSTNPNFNPDEVTPVDVTSNPGTINGLTASTNYYAYVRANCGDLGYSEWSTAYCQFATACDVIAALGYSENFDSYTAGNNVLPTCWNYINTTTYSSYQVYPRVYANGSYSTYANTAPNCLYLYSYYSSYTDYDPKPQYAILPEMDNLDGKQITLYAKGYNASSTLKVGRMTDPTNASTFSLIQELTLTTSYQEFSVELTGTGNYIALMIDAATSSRTSNGVYVDDIIVENVPTCKKPSALKCDSKTAHTATLSWTNGEEGQNAWQIAYSTTADFNPDEVTPVDVTTNPATIEGLAQSTTYYAYVRANCGDGDYSAWCKNKVTFTTLAGNVTPTGLAVNASTITSNQATASWNAVAGNILHESYDIYWAPATVTAVPEEPAAPNFISGITTTSQVLNGLDPETSYKVWVRDNCGTDGYSTWSSAFTFTTAASCQTPNGLVAIEVTNESAKITWNTYGQDDFNLQYRISGEEWDANNIISHVNTPYTLNPPLTGSTTYEVRVQAACNTDEWSNAVSFKTQCDHEPFPWSENFDEWTSKSECWSFLSGQYNNGNGPATTSSSAWSLNSEYGSYITLSGKALTMNLYSSNKYWAVTPIIDITTDDALLSVDVAVSAWSSATPNFDNNDTLAFAISTNGGATFTSLRVLDGAELNTLGNSYTTIYVPVTGYNGQAVRFAIFGGSISGTSPYDNRCVIDNVSVDETPSCYPVGTLSAATDVTYNSAKLSWALNDNTQTEWTVQYATNATFTEGVGTETAITNTNYELTGLTPETHYGVRVKAACSTTEDWSNAIDFETEEFCAVDGLTAANITQTTADLNWNGESDSYNIQYRTAVQPGMIYLSEDFEDGIPTDWDNTVHSSTYVWNVGSTSGSGHSNSTQNAYFYPNTSSSFVTAWLVTPAMNLEGVTAATLSFSYVNAVWAGGQDELYVYYRVNGGDWTLLESYTDNQATWTDETITLTGLADNYQIGFYGTNMDEGDGYDYGYGIGIDNVSVAQMLDAGTWQNTTSATENKQLTGLAAGTTYDVQVQGVCGGVAGNWSDAINFTTLPFTKTIEGNKWYFIASPVGTAPTNMDDLTDLYFYDEQDHFWRNKENTANAAGFDFAIGTGYLCANADPTLETTPETLTLTFTGAPVVDDTYEVPVTYHATTSGENPQTNSLAGWNLVGNPFTCDAYIAESYFVAPATNGGQAVAREGAIACCEGVMVKVEEENTEEGVGYITFSKTPLTKSKGGVEMILTQHATDRNGLSTGSIDNAIVSFNEGSQLEKFVFNADNAKLYIPQNGKDYAIVSTEGQGEMPVSFKAAENGQYTLTVIPEGVNMAYLHLIDNKTGADIDLLQTPSYTFNATTTDYTSRFRLVFATGSNDDSDNFAFCSNGNWIISNEGQATLQVIDITGRILSSETVNGSVSKAINAAPGVYVLRLINGDNVKVQKIVVR